MAGHKGKRLIQDKKLKACPESIEGEKDKSFGDDKCPAIMYEAAEVAGWQ